MSGTEVRRESHRLQVAWATAMLTREPAGPSRQVVAMDAFRDYAVDSTVLLVRRAATTTVEGPLHEASRKGTCCPSFCNEDGHPDSVPAVMSVVKKRTEDYSRLAAGNSITKLKRVPQLSRVSSFSSEPIASTRRRQIARPSPVPEK